MSATDLTTLPQVSRPMPISVEPTDDEARWRLRRMQWVATGLLLAMAALFVAAHLNLARHPAWGYVAAFAEAAMVGALADWFAVVALFRRPLGLPIWHTAIIPNSKDDIARNLGHFVETHFASLEVIVQRVRAVDPAARLTQWLLREENARQVGALLASALRHALASVDHPHLRAQLANALTARLEQVDLEDRLAEFGFSLIADKKHEEVFDWAVQATQTWLDTDAADATISGALDKVLDNKLLALFKGSATQRIRSGLRELLESIHKDPSHPARQRYADHIRARLVSLKTDPAVSRRLKEVQHSTLNHTRVQSSFAGLWDEIHRWLNDDLAHTDPQLGRHAAQIAHQWGQKLAADTRTRAWINESLVDYLTPLIAENRGRVAAFIHAQIDAWSKEEMTQRIELAVGRDLQFIRINGTVVGGMVGLLIFSVTHVIRI